MESEVIGRPRPSIVVRRRLLDRIDAATDGVVLITAGAGMGKSTLLEQLRAGREAAGGVGVVVGGGEVGSAAGVVAALLDALDRAGSDAGVSSVVDALWSHAPTGVLVVVDDAHHLDPADLRDLGRLARQLPGNAELVVASRETLAGLTADAVPYRAPSVITEEDLLFDDDELEELVGEGTLASAESLRWPARASLTVAVGATMADEYLWSEILRWLGPAERHAVAVAAHLGTFDGDLVRRFCPDVENLRALFGSIPLFSEQPPGRWHAHALWADVLAGLLDGALCREIDRAAAGREIEPGRFEAGASRLLRAGAWDELDLDRFLSALRTAHDLDAKRDTRAPPRARPAGVHGARGTGAALGRGAT